MPCGGCYPSMHCRWYPSMTCRGCYPSMHCRWYPSMPCRGSAPRGGVCSGGVPAPGGAWWRPAGWLLLRAVRYRILLECMLVLMFICRFQQNFRIGNLIDDEVFFEIQTTGNYTCNGTTPVAMRRQGDSCTSVYFKDKDCHWVDVLPKEELCYVKCKCPDYPSSCDGMVIIHSEPGQLEWGICPLNLA